METEKYRSNTISGGIQSTALSPEVSKVLRSTYMLLGTTIAFSAYGGHIHGDQCTLFWTDNAHTLLLLPMDDGEE